MKSELVEKAALYLARCGAEKPFSQKVTLDTPWFDKYPRAFVQQPAIQLGQDESNRQE